MRTTLDLDDEVLAAVKELARRQRVSAGALISRLLRERLSGSLDGTPRGGAQPKVNAAGFRPLPRRGTVVSNDLVNILRETDGV